jgi:hypothetical protein
MMSMVCCGVYLSMSGIRCSLNHKNFSPCKLCLTCCTSFSLSLAFALKHNNMSVIIMAYIYKLSSFCNKKHYICNRLHGIRAVTRINFGFFQFLSTAKLARYSIFTYFHVCAVLHIFKNSILFFFIVINRDGFCFII